MVKLHVRVHVTVLGILLSGAAACSDGNDLGHPGRLDPLVGLVVSPPVSYAAGTSGAFRSGPASGVTAYVSLLPGSVPSGLAATVRDPVTGASATLQVVDGGFDPVAIPANVGDTLVVQITLSGGQSPLLATQVVPAGRPPVVVRTEPAPKKVDVPLNSVMMVVFSTPIDSTTLSTSSVQLWMNGSTTVSGTVRVADSTGFRVEFQPSALLVANTVYDLLLTPAIHDVNGAAFDSTLDVMFTTGVNEQALAFTVLSVSGGYSCGVTTTAAAYCWGVNSEGELGSETPISAECSFCSTIPVPVAGNLTLQSVSLGPNHACAVTVQGAAYCWGSTNGGLGADTTTTNACFATGYYDGCPYPVAVMGGLTFASVTAGLQHSCGVTPSGAAYCWGWDGSGAAGADSATMATSCRTRYSTSYCRGPVPVAGALTFASVSAGNSFSCGVATSGAAYCWGSNDAGQLGAGTIAGPEQCTPTLPCSHTPVAVVGGFVFATVMAGDSSACGLTPGGAAYCWGYNGGLLGSAVSLGSITAAPVRVGGNLAFAAFAMGHQYACGVTETGAAYCWGIGDNGVFGSGTTVHYNATPVQVVGGHPFTAVGAAGGVSDHSCGLTPDGTAYCWGANIAGELGNGSTTSSLVPMEVLGQ